MIKVHSAAVMFLIETCQEWLNAAAALLERQARDQVLWSRSSSPKFDKAAMCCTLVEVEHARVAGNLRRGLLKLC